MHTVRVNDILQDRILVSRESAHLLEDALNAMMAAAKVPGSPTSITVDFDGVAGIAPSFLDELLSIFNSIIGPETAPSEWSMVVTNPPTRLSLKFEAVARGHGLSVRSLPDGSWVLTNPRNEGA